MAFLISAVLPFLVAAFMAISCAVVWREQLTRPVVYCVVSFLLFLGMHQLVKSLVVLAKNLWPIGQGYFLVITPITTEGIEAFERHMAIEGLVIAGAVAILSYPFIALIKGGFEK